MSSSENTNEANPENNEEKIAEEQTLTNSKSDIQFVEFLKPEIRKVPFKTSIRLTPVPEKNSSEITDESGNLQEIEQKGKFGKCPAQNITEKSYPIPYKEPSWSGIPESPFSFEILKGGIILQTIKLDKPYFVIGRSEQSDIKLEHPSISRFHCILQYKSEDSDEHPPGMYLYDLESTHGTFHNKNKINPKSYNRLRVGHIVKFGLSTRMFVLQGPIEDEEEGSPHTVTELKEMAAKRKQAIVKSVIVDDLENSNEKADKMANDGVEDEGISWGMREDAQEEEDGEWNEQNPFAANEELYLDDPKKTLRGWFEREGHDLPNYQIEDISSGHYRCKLEIPFPSMSGGPFVCVVDHKGKKKDTVIQCALEACRRIDHKGLLRQATHESHRKKKKDWSENDYYDSDEDDYLDRTGDVEKKRKKRKTDSTDGGNIETFDSLIKKYTVIVAEMESLEKKLNLDQQVRKTQKRTSDIEDLDDYINSIQTPMADKHKLATWRAEASKLQKEEEKIRRLLNIAKPAHIKEFMPRNSLVSVTKTDNPLLTSRKSAARLKVTGVHRAFLQDEETPKLKLSKLDDNDHDVQPIPYAKPQKTVDRYKELLKLKEKLAMKNELEDSVMVQPHSNDEKRKSVEKEVVIEPVRKDSVEEDTKGSIVLKPVDRELVIEEERKDVTDSQPDCKMIGPSLPPCSEESRGDNMSPCPITEFKMPIVPNKVKTKPNETKSSKNKFSFDVEYESWVPPSGQTGDGRTSLNEKLGY